MRYEAPGSVKEASALLAKERGASFVLAGGTDLLVRMKGGFIEPDLVVDIKRIKPMSEVRKSASGFEIGAAVPCCKLGENSALQEGLAGRRRSRQSHRLEAGSGPLHHRRQSLQCLARRRQRAGPGCRRRQGRDRRAEEEAGHSGRAGPGRLPAAPRSPRARSSPRSSCRSARRAAPMPICVSFRAAKWTLRW